MAEQDENGNFEAVDDQEQNADVGEQAGEQEQQLQGVGKKFGGKAKRTLAPDNVKRSDIAPWDRNDKKASWQAWKMATRRMLKDSNISEKRQVSFVLSALQGGSASAVLARGPEGPPSDISIGSFWKTLGHTLRSRRI